jgi:hypothetical protein
MKFDGIAVFEEKGRHTWIYNRTHPLDFRLALCEYHEGKKRDRNEYRNTGLDLWL